MNEIEAAPRDKLMRYGKLLSDRHLAHDAGR